MKIPYARLALIVEAVMCVVLAGMAIIVALKGAYIAWLFGFGALSFAFDLWRRLKSVRTDVPPQNRITH